MIKLSIEEVLSKIPNVQFQNDTKQFSVFEKYPININKDRYFSFKKNGTTCEKCGVKGEYFSLDTDNNKGRSLTLHGTKDGEDIIISSVGKKAINPMYKKGTVLCTECLHEDISHNKSNGFKNRKNEYKKYKEEFQSNENLNDSPFKDLLKNYMEQNK